MDVEEDTCNILETVEENKDGILEFAGIETVGKEGEQTGKQLEWILANSVDQRMVSRLPDRTSMSVDCMVSLYTMWQLLVQRSINN